MARRRRKIRLIFVKKRLFEHKVMKPKSTQTSGYDSDGEKGWVIFVYFFYFFGGW
jgi:hypothetical protein